MAKQKVFQKGLKYVFSYKKIKKDIGDNHLTPCWKNLNGRLVKFTPNSEYGEVFDVRVGECFEVSIDWCKCIGVDK